MRSILIAGPMIMFTLVAAAQSLPSVPNLPAGGNVPTATPTVPTVPGVTPPSGTSVPSVGTSVPGAGQGSNPIEKAKIEAECKIPTNATKPECIKLMLNQ